MIFDIPCLPGEKVYFLENKTEKINRKKFTTTIIKCAIIDCITIGQALSPIITVCDDENTWIDFDINDDLGIIVFLTFEEAESNIIKSD